MHLLRAAVGHERDGIGIQVGIRGDPGEAFLLRLPVFVVLEGGEGAARDLRKTLADNDEPRRVMKGERREQQSVEHAEDRCRGSDAESQRQDRSCGESGSVA